MISRLKDVTYEILVNKLFRNYAPDKFYLNFLYKRKYGYSIDWNNPKTFNEKLQWMKIYDHNPMYTVCADKVQVRKYVEDTIGKDYLIPLVGIYDNPEEIDVNILPTKFVLKLNTGAAYNIVCTDKNKITKNEIVNNYNKWMKEKFYLRYREYHYKPIVKKIVCEQFLENADGTPLFDYKVFCFDGEPYLIMVMLGEKYDNHRNLYNINWTRHSGYITAEQDDFEVPEPMNLEEMLMCARKLSRGFKEVRVDFYIVNNKLYFGEMTFFSGAGFSQFSSYNFDLELGNRIKL